MIDAFVFFPVCFKVYNCQAKHLQVRKDCIDFMRRNREKFEAVKYFDSIKSCLHKKKNFHSKGSLGSRAQFLSNQ